MKEMDLVSRFNFALGQVMGGMATDEINKYLNTRAVTRKQIDAFKKAIDPIAMAAYYVFKSEKPK